jgi:hypothetical protein
MVLLIDRLYPPEILPLAFRVKGVSISTATNWLFNYIVGEATPVLQEVLSWKLYPMFALFCAMSFVLVYFGSFFVPPVSQSSWV